VATSTTPAPASAGSPWPTRCIALTKTRYAEYYFRDDPHHKQCLDAAAHQEKDLVRAPCQRRTSLMR